jgi:sarcosine oxidase gamma subunit
VNQLPEPLTALLGITWPGTVGAEARGNGVQADVLCVGPTEWWVIAESSRRAVLHQQLNEAL